MGDEHDRPDLGEARKILRRAVPRAAEVMVKLLDSQDERLRLRAAEAILSTEALNEPEPIQGWRMKGTG